MLDYLLCDFHSFAKMNRLFLYLDIEVQVTSNTNEVAQLKIVDSEVTDRLTVLEEQVNGEFPFIFSPV